MKRNLKKERLLQEALITLHTGGASFKYLLDGLKPIFDLVLRIYLGQIFFISGLLKIMDWDKALYLSQHEYPVSWLDPILAAYVGVSIELVASAFLIIGLLTRFAAFSMLLLTLVIQIEYQVLNTQSIWILLMGWFVIMGAGKLSLDHLMRGIRDSAIVFSRPISLFFTEITRFVGPFYKLTLRFWIACILITGGWLVLGSVGDAYPYPVLGYQFSNSWISILQNHWYEVLLIVSGALIGLGFISRWIALFLLGGIAWVACASIPLTDGQINEAVGWVFLLGLILLYGPGTISLDHGIRHGLRRKLRTLLNEEREKQGKLPEVVIIGGGFGGVAAAKALKTTACHVTLIDKHNYHLFQPLLYQVATAGLSPAEIAAPIRALFDDQPNISIVLGEVVDVESTKQTVILKSGDPLHYDYLIIATGAQHSYFGQDAWAAHAPGLKKIEDALSIRQKMLTSFEMAENAKDPDMHEALLTLVIIGGGPTGIELAGAFAELAYQGMENEFRQINPKNAKIILIEAGPRLLGVMPESLANYTEKALTHLGVTVLLNSRVEKIDENGVTANGVFIPTKNVFWAAGVQASSASKWLNASTDRAGRIEVGPDLSVPGCNNVYAIGDTVLANAWNGKPMPGLAPAAKQSGQYIAKLIQRRIEEQTASKPFKYRHYGSLATIGRSLAVVDFGKFQLSGTLAWWFWGGIHLYFINNMRNRMMIMLQWFWSYITFKKSSRIIYESDVSEPKQPEV